ncbi:MAG: recombinase family protein, partial [Oscillospiraceae bacterium]
MQRVALYIRVSTDEQALHGYSLESQKESLTEYALKNNMYIIDYYIDDGYSARKKYTNRKNFMRMLNDVEHDKIDIILFIKLDRWFRSVKDYYKIQEILENHNVYWKTTSEHYDTETANGRLHVNIRLSVAQDESDRTSERIKFVFDNKIKRGEVITGSTPFGLKIEDKRIVPDKETISIVHDIFNHFELNQSKRGTLSYIRDKYHINLCEATLRRLLRNPLYKGEYRGLSNYCEPIIEPTRFDKIQTISSFTNVRQTPTNSIYIFTSILVCYECKHKMTGHRTPTSSSTYYYYRCNQHSARKLCSHNKSINEQKIEKYLLDNIENEINTYLINYELESAALIQKPKIDKAKIKNKLSKLKELYINDLISMDEYRKDYDMFTSQLQESSFPTSTAPNLL